MDFYADLEEKLIRNQVGGAFGDFEPSNAYLCGVDSISTIRGNGKFLLAGEYAVVKGAKSFAIPLKYGQTLTVRRNSSTGIHWRSTMLNSPWFDAVFDNELNLVSSSDEEIAAKLQEILQFCSAKNTSFLAKIQDTFLAIDADFDLEWGLGSSSTLIYCLAELANINPYELQYEMFGGSGFDIACAGNNNPIFFTRNGLNPEVEEVAFFPEYHENLAFVYLGEKMNSRTSMKKVFQDNPEHTLEAISGYADKFPKCSSVEELEGVINSLERLTSTYIGLPTIKEERFSDYPFSIKSMGAWGGDFVLATGRNFDTIKTYFQGKGLNTIFKFKEMLHPSVIKEKTH